MKLTFKIGSFELKAEGNTVALQDVVIETEMTGEEFIQNSKDGVAMIKEIMSVAAAEQVAAQARRDERAAERAAELAAIERREA